MANEATLVMRTELPLNFVVGNGTGIEKGALLKLADPMTASSANGLNDVLAGIAASEKIASDGKTGLGVFRRGVFRMTASGAITVGDPVGSIATFTNMVQSQKATLTLSGARTLGTALETVTSGAILIDVNVGQSWGNP